MDAIHDKHELDTPARGADPVNDEFEVGYDETFETHWRRAEIVGRLIMLAFVGAALAGFMGHGPFSHASARSSTGDFRVGYEPIARYGTPTTVTLHIANRSAIPRTVRIRLAFAIIQKLGLQRVLPRPTAMDAVPGGIAMTFKLAADTPDAVIRINAQPSSVGLVHLSARLGANDEAYWSQVIAP